MNRPGPGGPGEEAPGRLPKCENGRIVISEFIAFSTICERPGAGSVGPETLIFNKFPKQQL